MTAQTEKVLLVMSSRPRAQHYGLAICGAASIKSGTLYPILARLEANGLVTSAWEDVDPSEAGRPPRKYYRLTGAGARVADDVRVRTSELLRSGRTTQRDLRPGIAW